MELPNEDLQEEIFDLDFESAQLARLLVMDGWEEKDAKRFAAFQQEIRELEKDREENTGLDNGPTEEQMLKREEVANRVNRFPEVGGNLALNSNLQEEIKKEKLPGQVEGNLAYMIYRSAGLQPNNAYSFATEGFLFDRYVGSYVPCDIARRICDATFEDREGDDIISVLDHMRGFVPTDLPNAVFEFGNSKDFNDASFVKKLPPEAKKIVWGSYLNRATDYLENNLNEL